MMYQFSIELAVERGIEEAIIFQNIYFWCKKNEANGKNFHEGKYWTYNSASAFCKLFPFWNQDKIRRLLNKMSEDGILYRSRFNQLPTDRTYWYSCNLHYGFFHNGGIHNGSGEKPQSYNTDVNNTDNTLREKTDEEVPKGTNRDSGESRQDQGNSTEHRSKRRSNQPEQKKYSTKDNLLPDTEVWHRFAPELYNWNQRFKNMSNMRFPKKFEPEAPASPRSFPDLTKKVPELALALDAIIKGKFFTHFAYASQSEVKGKYPALINKLRLSGNITLPEITAALELYQDLFIEGNFPPDKKILTKDLSTWLFNFRTKKSWFLYCLNSVVTGHRDFQTAEIELSDHSKEIINNLSEMFPESETKLHEIFAHWWSWMQPRVVEAANMNTTSNEEKISHWGHLIDDSAPWIEEYTDFLWDKREGDIAGEFIKGGSKWAIGFIRNRMYREDEQWYLSPEELSKSY